MRISGGNYRGRKLFVPGSGLRPTTDRVRQALYNILGPLDGGSFLDLYAGSGSVGLEACSRGAGRVVCVEQDRRSCVTIEKNAAMMGAALEVVCGSVPVLLRQWASGRFDTVFMDPPYHSDADKAAFEAVEWDTIVNEGGRIVYEASSRERVPVFPGFQLLKQRKYGESSLYFYEKVTGDG